MSAPTVGAASGFAWLDGFDWIVRIREIRRENKELAEATARVDATRGGRDMAGFSFACLVTGEMARGYDLGEARQRVAALHPEILVVASGEFVREAEARVQCLRERMARSR